MVKTTLNIRLSLFIMIMVVKYIKLLNSFISTNDISHCTKPPHTLEHNGLSKRRHHHIIETGLSFLTHASIPLTY